MPHFEKFIFKQNIRAMDDQIEMKPRKPVDVKNFLQNQSYFCIF